MQYLLLTIACCFVVTVVAQDLTTAQVEEAIALGKSGRVPVVRIRTFSGDFDIFIDGPIARISAAAAIATLDYKPFTATNVTPEMMAPVYRIRVEPREQRLQARFIGVKNIVVQPKGAKGMDGVIQPLKLGFSEAMFDRLPEGEFQIVVVAREGPQTYTVSENDRSRIR